MPTIITNIGQEHGTALSQLDSLLEQLRVECKRGKRPYVAMLEKEGSTTTLFLVISPPLEDGENLANGTPQNPLVEAGGVKVFVASPPTHNSNSIGWVSKALQSFPGLNLEDGSVEAAEEGVRLAKANVERAEQGLKEAQANAAKQPPKPASPNTADTAEGVKPVAPLKDQFDPIKGRRQPAASPPAAQ